MKTKFTLIVTVIAGLVMGFLAGRIQTVKWYREEVFTPYIYQRDAGNVDYFSHLLTSLRSGHTEEAITSLEQSLDNSLLSLQNLPAGAETRHIVCLRDLTAEADTNSIRDAILQARDYRTQNPWDKTPRGLELKLQSVLTSVE
jgi:hypothetical protein